MRRIVVLVLWTLIPNSLVRAESADLFEQRIRPVLHEHCLECHGPEKQKGGLRVDSREALLQGGESGPAIVVGNPGASLLLKAVGQLDPDLKMPPPGCSEQCDRAARFWLALAAVSCQTAIQARWSPTRWPLPLPQGPPPPIRHPAGVGPRPH